jgi:putative lipoic acid-binding regulatory protein
MKIPVGAALLIVGTVLLSYQQTTVNAFTIIASQSKINRNGCYSTCLHASQDAMDNSSSNGEGGQKDSQEEEEEGPVFSEATVKIDDGGSDLTDRFKYKVNALMGTYDPQSGDMDNEQQDGNILNAMLNFPTEYTFNIVGRTGGDASTAESYVEMAKEALRLGSGMTEAEYVTTPRGKKFTKVTITATMQSAAMINLVYQELANLEMTVMRF